MKLATFNVNSIRKRLPVVKRWLSAHAPDVLCLQETKVQDAEFPECELAATGYHVKFRGMKGYNGVAICTRREPEWISFEFGRGVHAEEPRFLHAVVDGIAIINTYVPQGVRIDHPRYQDKLNWLKRLHRYFTRHLSPDAPAIWCGDMNVAPEPLDVHHPDAHLNHVCFHHEARAMYRHTVNWGFEDVFRRLYPDRQQFTFWDYRQPDALKANRGWRIDHILATRPLARRCLAAEVDLNPRKGNTPSDHTVLWAEFSVLDKPGTCRPGT